MRDALIAILLCGLAVAACEANQADKPEPVEISADFAADTDTDVKRDTAGSGDAAVQFHADTDSGEMAVKLPGGIEGRIKLPEGLDGDSKFDLDGIGRYPGSKLIGVDVKAFGGDDKSRAKVQLDFTAPGSADTVADWHEKAFAAKGRSVLRSGTTLSTTTSDGEPLQMALRDGPGGTARGQISIRDEKN
ncbi:MAG: hypothetical protein ACOYO0_06575 [Sandarakinorhabdus sp.]